MALAMGSMGLPSQESPLLDDEGEVIPDLSNWPALPTWSLEELELIRSGELELGTDLFKEDVGGVSYADLFEPLPELPVELRFVTGDVGDTEVLPDIDIEGIGDRSETLPDRILIYAHDGEDALAEVHRRGLDPVGSLVRRSSLEDVFLRLTGRTLVD